MKAPNATGMSRTLATAAAATLLFAGLSATGCRMSGEEGQMAMTPAQLNQVDFWIESHADEDVLVGEIVTLTARDRNTAGLNPEIEWLTTGGTLTTERNNRIARVQFDRPGTYTITSRIMAEDIVISDSVDIRVRPVH